MSASSEPGTATPPARRMSGENRRASILAAARALFAREGYHGTCGLDIAAAAGCSEALVYRHFGTKLELFTETVRDGARRALGRIEETIARSDDPFRELCRAWPLMAGDPEMADLLRVRSLAVTLVDEPEVRRTLEEIASDFRRLVPAAVEASQAAGHVRPDLDPMGVAALYGGLSFSAAFLMAVEGDRGLVPLRLAAETLARVLEPDPSPPSRGGSR